MVTEELWRQYKSKRSLCLRNKIVLELQPCVKTAASQVLQAAPPGVEYDDLVSAGNLALLAAMPKIDPERAGVMLYVWRVIVSAMTGYLKRQQPMVHLDVDKLVGPEPVTEEDGVTLAGLPESHQALVDYALRGYGAQVRAELIGVSYRTQKRYMTEIRRVMRCRTS